MLTYPVSCVTETGQVSVESVVIAQVVNHLMPNDHFSGRTAR